MVWHLVLPMMNSFNNIDAAILPSTVFLRKQMNSLKAKKYNLFMVLSFINIDNWDATS